MVLANKNVIYKNRAILNLFITWKAAIIILEVFKNKTSIFWAFTSVF